MTDLNDNSDTEHALMAAAIAILEPLAGMLLAHQARYAQAEELFKAAFVQASARAYAAQGKVPTVSALSVTTGLRRREVKRLLELAAQNEAPHPAEQVSPVSQARLRWTTDPRFLDTRGQPLALPRTQGAGRPSFADLAATVSKDIHPKALLDELLRIGVAEVVDEAAVLRHRFAAPKRDLKGKLEIGGANVGDHLSAVLLNLLSDPAPLMERAVFADGLTEVSAWRGVALAQSVWEQVLPDLRSRLQDLVTQDSEAEDAGWRMRIGVYSYLAPTQSVPAPVRARSNKSRAKAAEPDRVAPDPVAKRPARQPGSPRSTKR